PRGVLAPPNKRREVLATTPPQSASNRLLGRSVFGRAEFYHRRVYRTRKSSESLDCLRAYRQPFRPTSQLNERFQHLRVRIVCIASARVWQHEQARSMNADRLQADSSGPAAGGREVIQERQNRAIQRYTDECDHFRAIAANF